MPSRLPLVSISAPPELPGLIAASVWMKFSKVLMPRWLRPERRDDAHGHRLADAERIADRQHHVADPRLFERAPSVIAGRFGSVDLDHREIGLGIGADHLGGRLAAVGQRDLDFIGRFDHVVVGQDVAFRADDHAGAEAELLLFLLAEAVAEKFAEERIVQERVFAAVALPWW